MDKGPNSLEASHAKVTAFKSLFVEMKEKLNGKPKTGQMDLPFHFEV